MLSDYKFTFLNYIQSTLRRLWIFKIPTLKRKMRAKLDRKSIEG